MSLEALAFVLWGAVTILAIGSLAYLVVTFGRIDRRVRSRLDDRLARGEITIDEYRARVAVLGS